MAVLALLPVLMLVGWLAAPSSLPTSAATDALAADGQAVLAQAGVSSLTVDTGVGVGQVSAQIPVVGPWLAKQASSMTAGMSNGDVPYWVNVGVGAGAGFDRQDVFAVVSAWADWSTVFPLLVLAVLAAVLSALLVAAAPDVAHRGRVAVVVAGYRLMLLAGAWMCWCVGVRPAVIEFFVADGQLWQATVRAGVAVSAFVVVSLCSYPLFAACLCRVADVRCGPRRVFSATWRSMLSSVGAVVVVGAALWMVGFVPVSNLVAVMYCVFGAVVGVFAVTHVFRDRWLVWPRR